jgi:hypothetical protein
MGALSGAAALSEVAKRGDELVPPGAATGRDWRQGIKRSGDVQTLFCGQCNPGSAPGHGGDDGDGENPNRTLRQCRVHFYPRCRSALHSSPAAPRSPPLS